MQTVRSCYLEVVLYETQQVLARVFGIDGFEISGDGQFVVHLRSIFLRDADFEGKKKVCSNERRTLSAKEIFRGEKVEGFLEDILKITTKPDGGGCAKTELGNNLVPRLEYLA